GKLDSLMTRFPGSRDLETRQERIESASSAAAAAAIPAPAPAPAQSTGGPRPPALSRDEIESELLSAIPDDEDDYIPAPPPPAEPVAVPAPDMSAALVQEENL